MTWWMHDDGYDFDKEVDIDVDADIDVDFDFDVTKDFDANINIDSHVNVSGNSTTIAFDAEALGSDTVVEVDVVALTIENELSSASGLIIAAAA